MLLLSMLFRQSATLKTKTKGQELQKNSQCNKNVTICNVNHSTFFFFFFLKNMVLLLLVHLDLGLIHYIYCYYVQGKWLIPGLIIFTFPLFIYFFSQDPCSSLTTH